MSMALQFGAGNIGRGFMAQLFFEAGYRTVFVEHDLDLVNRLNERKKYLLRLLDAYTQKEVDLIIENFHAVSSDDSDKVGGLFAKADVAATAVGIENLPQIAPLIAAGIRQRRQQDGRPVDIYLCENAFGASQTLRQHVYDHLDSRHKGWAEENIGFVGTSVARMVPAPTDRFKGIDPLFVAADSFRDLPYDARMARAARLPIETMKPVANFRAEVERKLFTHNLGHAALAYMGYLKGYTYVHESYQDPDLRSIFTGALKETSRALVEMYPEDLNEQEHAQVVKDVNVRFSNPMIMDTVYRVGRDPMRKLGPEDRLIGSAKLCLSQGITPEIIAEVCGAAFCFDYSGDPSAVRMQEMIRSGGIVDTLQKVSGVDAGTWLGGTILDSYKQALRERGDRSKSTT